MLSEYPTSRPTRLVDISLRSNVLLILMITKRSISDRNNCSFWFPKSIHGTAEVSEVYILAQKVKQRHKIAFLFRFLIKIGKIRF